MAYVHPTLRTKLFPTSVSDINRAYIEAGMPDPSERDLRPLQAILAALPKAHPGVMADMQTRENSIIGFDWAIKAGLAQDDTSAPQIEIDRAGEIMERYKDAGLHNEHRTYMKSIFYGATAVDPLWGVNERGQNAIMEYDVVPAIELKPWPKAATGWARLMYSRYNSDKYTILPYDDPQAVIIAHYNPLRGVDNSHAGGLFSTVLWYSYLQYVTWYHWGRSGERMGVLTYPQSPAQNDDIDKAYEFLQEVVDHAIKMPENLKFIIRELMGDPPSPESYEKFITKIDDMRSRLVLGQDVVNSAHKEGTYAQAKEANKTTLDYNYSDIQYLQNIITDQYVRTDYILNYGRPTTGIWPEFVFITDEQEDHLKNAQKLSQLTSAGYEPEDDDEVSRQVGIRVRKSENPSTNIPM